MCVQPLTPPSTSCRRLRKPLDEVRADELARTPGSMRSQAPGYGMLSVHAPRCANDVNSRSMVTRTHMSCTGIARRAHAGQQREVVILGVDQVRLDVEQAVLAPIAVEDDAARSAGARAGRWAGTGACGHDRAIAGAARPRPRRPARNGDRIGRNRPILRCGRERAATGGVPMSFVLALDQGTTSSRAIVFDRDGARARASRSRSSGRSSRSPAGSSTTPTEIWATQSGVVHEALAKARHRARATSPRSASPTSARRRSSGSARPAGRSPTRSSGRTGAPRRCATSCAHAGHAPTFARKTGLVLDAYFSGTKLAWLLDHVARRARARRARRARVRHHRRVARLEPDRRARARHRRDATRAARCCSTSTRGDWDDELLRTARRAARGAAAIVRVVGRVRRRRRSAARAVPIAGIAGDQQAALFGQACLAPGPGEEHLRHRLLPADEHRRARRSRRATPR